MADLAYITLPNNVTYNFKDSNAVTLNTDQTITGSKTFNAIYFTNALYKKNSSNENAGYIGTVDGVVGSTSVLQQWYFAEKSYNSTTGAISSYAETYFLPAVNSDRTADGSYNILTSKNAVTVAQGGTGATSASGAITNLGAVDLTSAQSISGKKTFTTDIAIKGNAPAIQQINSAGTVMAQEWLTNDTTNSIMHGLYYDFQVYSYNSSTGAIKSQYERYRFPTVNADRTDNGVYYILTSKNAVTIEQGGTGATTAANARTALDVYATSDSCKRIYFSTSANTQKNITVNGQAAFLLVISCSYAACRTVAVGYVNTSKTAYVTSLSSNATGVTFTTSTAGKLGITTTYASYCLIIPYMGIDNISV